MKKLFLSVFVLSRIFFLRGDDLARGEEFIAPLADDWSEHMPAGYVHQSFPDHVVRLLYLVPSDRTAQENAEEKIRQCLLLCQEWYRDQMERNGFGRKTFKLETEADGVTPIVHVVNAPNTASYYQADPWTRVSVAAQNAGFPVWSPGQVWLQFFETHVMNSDSSISGTWNGGTGLGSGDDAGVAMTCAITLTLLSPEHMIDDRIYEGLIFSQIGPYPLIWLVSFPWYEGNSVSSLSSVYHGVVLHELSHCFGVYHDHRNDNNFQGNMMGHGLRGFRGWVHPDRYRDDEMRLSYGAAVGLNVSRYFNPERTYSDSTRPSLSILSSGAITPVDGLLPVRFTASDSSGVAAAQLRLGGDTVDEVVLTGNSVDHTFATPYYVPGEANNYMISVYDTQGNRQDGSFSITPSSGGNQAPKPHLYIHPSKAASGEEITLDASESLDPDSLIPGISALSFEWDLNGDGIYETEPSQDGTLSVSFPSDGMRLIKVRVTDPEGASCVSSPIAVRIETPPSAVPRGWWNQY